MKGFQPNYQTSRLKNVLFSHNVWWVDLDWLPGTSPATLTFHPQHDSGDRIRWKITWVELRTACSLSSYCHRENSNDEFEFIAN